jgi:hypothetical protein
LRLQRWAVEHKSFSDVLPPPRQKDFGFLRPSHFAPQVVTKYKIATSTHTYDTTHYAAMSPTSHSVEESSSSSAMHQQQQQKSIVAKKSVTFCYHVHIQDVERLQPESDQVLIDSLWYGKQDFTAFRQRDARILEIIDHMDEQQLRPPQQQQQTVRNTSFSSSSSLEEMDTFLCTRGLEDRIKQGYVARVQNRIQAREAVLNEQYLQTYEEYHSDADSLADIYRRFTSCSKRQARLLGIKDEKFVEDHVRASNNNNNNSLVHANNEIAHCTSGTTATKQSKIGSSSSSSNGSFNSKALLSRWFAPLSSTGKRDRRPRHPRRIAGQAA